MQEESKNKKSKWGRPKLIILTRGMPEEKVLLSCKGTYNPGGPRATWGSCFHWTNWLCGYSCESQMGS
jgi:hypothetical protein